jgi:ribokinase
MPPRVVVIGSTNVDLTFRVARLPRPGETVAASGLLTGFGGKGANQAVMAARLGADVTFVSAVGDDDGGRHYLDHLRAQGVDVGLVRPVHGVPTGTAAIFVGDDGQNVIAVVAGANASVTPALAREAASAIRAAGAVVAQMETPADATAEAFRLAREAGVPTVLNPAPAAGGVSDELLSLADLVVPNESELEALTGLPGDGADDQLPAATAALRRRGPRAVLLTRGERGALLDAGGATTAIPTPRVEAVDATAAGDAFVGALAVGLASGLGAEAAARRACVVAALTVTRPGAQASFPSRDEIVSALAAHGLSDLGGSR